MLQLCFDSASQYFSGRGMENGAAVGIRFINAEYRRFCVFIVLGKPWSMLGWEIQESDAFWKGVSSELGVQYKIPLEIRTAIPEVPDGRELSV